jgi:hypothetical protein
MCMLLYQQPKVSSCLKSQIILLRIPLAQVFLAGIPHCTSRAVRWCLQYYFERKYPCSKILLSIKDDLRWLNGQWTWSPRVIHTLACSTLQHAVFTSSSSSSPCSWCLCIAIRSSALLLNYPNTARCRHPRIPLPLVPTHIPANYSQNSLSQDCRG